MGDPATAPALPRIESTLLPESQIDITFIQRECNWLQAAEGELDTSHIGFLYYGSLQRDEVSTGHVTKYSVANRAPEYVSEETAYGYIYAAHRPTGDGRTYWRFGQFLYPFWTMPPIAAIENNFLTRAYVPIDNDTCMIVIIERRGIVEPLEAQAHLKGHPGPVAPDGVLPNSTDWKGRWRLAANATNDYGIDRNLQRDESYTGLHSFILQDQMITESMGRTVDRSLEHLAPSDIMISRTRRCLLAAAEAFAKTGELPATATDPSAFEAVHGGHFVVPEEIDWPDAYNAQLAAAPFPAAAGG